MPIMVPPILDFGGPSLAMTNHSAPPHWHHFCTSHTLNNTILTLFSTWCSLFLKDYSLYSHDLQLYLITFLETCLLWPPLEMVCFSSIFWNLLHFILVWLYDYTCACMGIHKHVPRESRSNPWVLFHRTLHFEKEPFAANWHSLSLGLTVSLSAPELFCLLLPSTEVSSPRATPITVGGCWIHKEVHVLSLSL